MADTILPHELPTALETRAGVRLLSLDCFDTLLWRDTHAPRDIFRLLSGTTPQQRMWAETRARRSALLRHSRNEVSIEEIYAELLPNADAATRAAAVDAEIDAEARHCFAFGPTVALMKAARERGIKTVIVSDTYLSGKQLRELIRRAAGDEVAGLIDTIFASSEHKLSKKEGLLGTMLRKTSVKPERVLHIGDNCAADHDAARRHGIPALHLRQFTDGCAQRLRLEAATGAMVDAGGAVFQPHRATLAAGAHRIEDAAEALGHNVLGPVLVPFANWLEQEAEALAATNGGRVHMLFLMRDGHLPRRIHEAAFPARAGHAIELSRFTATAASFRDEAAVHDYVEAELGNGTPEDLLRQLLFPPNEIAEIIEALPETAQLGALAKTVCAPRHIKAIVKRSQAFAERLATYLRRECDPQPGDTLLLADLGYNGTVQNHAEPVLRALLGVHVAGRYLLLREQAATGFDKRGFMDGSTHDADTLEAFAANVAVLEQLCTAAQGSVIDYSDDGSPVRAGNSIKGRQSETRERAQRGAIAFARDHAQAIIRTNDSARAECERSGAAAALARLMFLPQPEELAVLTRFEHDVNLGGSETVKLFDPEIAKAGLERRGLFYLKGADRMYLPAELRGHGLPLNLTLLAQRRFGMDLRFADFCDHGIDVPILLADGRDVAASSIRATPTHNGHYLATIPVGEAQYAVGLQFGKLYEWLQIVSAEFVPVADFLAEKPSDTQPIEAMPTLEGMEQVAPHLFRCTGADSFLMVPPHTNFEGPAMLAVAFRPLVAREPASSPAPTAATEAAPVR